MSFWLAQNRFNHPPICREKRKTNIGAVLTLFCISQILIRFQTSWND